MVKMSPGDTGNPAYTHIPKDPCDITRFHLCLELAIYSTTIGCITQYILLLLLNWFGLSLCCLPIKSALLTPNPIYPQCLRQQRVGSRRKDLSPEISPGNREGLSGTWKGLSRPLPSQDAGLSMQDRADHAGQTENSRLATGQAGSPRPSFSLFIMIFTIVSFHFPSWQSFQPRFLQRTPQR